MKPYYLGELLVSPRIYRYKLKLTVIIVHECSSQVLLDTDTGIF